MRSIEIIASVIGVKNSNVIRLLIPTRKVETYPNLGIISTIGWVLMTSILKIIGSIQTLGFQRLQLSSVPVSLMQMETVHLVVTSTVQKHGVIHLVTAHIMRFVSFENTQHFIT